VTVKNLSQKANSIIKFIPTYRDENGDEEPSDAVELKSGEVCVCV
jgi:hypothetical protein